MDESSPQWMEIAVYGDPAEDRCYLCAKMIDDVESSQCIDFTVADGWDDDDSESITHWVPIAMPSESAQE